MRLSVALTRTMEGAEKRMSEGEERKGEEERTGLSQSEYFGTTMALSATFGRRWSERTLGVR